MTSERPEMEIASRMDHKDEKISHGEEAPDPTTPEGQVPRSDIVDSTTESTVGDDALETGTDSTSDPAGVTMEQQKDEPGTGSMLAGDRGNPRDEGELGVQAAEAPKVVDTASTGNDEHPSAPLAEGLPETIIDAPVNHGPAPAIVLVPSRQHRPMGWLTWHYSAIFPVALLALVTTLFFAPIIEQEPESIAFRVLEDGTGAPLAGVEISVNEQVMTSDAEGIVHVAKTDDAVPYRIVGDGFPTATGTLDPKRGARQQVSIPRLANASAARGVGASALDSTSGLQNAGGQAPASEAVSPSLEAAAISTPKAGKVRQPGTGDIEGTILSEAGDPLRGARITDGKTLAITGKDGIFTLDRAKLAENASLTISAPGFADQTLAAADAGAPIKITLEPRPINALYLNPNISTTEADVDRLIEIIDTTDANAIVIDIKEELIFYDSKVEFFVDAGTVNPIIDLPALLKKFQDHGIYTIARLVVFKDSLVAENKPDLAVLNNQTGDLWRDMNGVSWVNPMEPELWEANSDLAVEAAEYGFDEIQYDYVRFPTDGDLSTTDYGKENTQENRENAIHGLLKLTRGKLLPTGAKLSADVFGYTLLVDDDLGIGQNFIKLAEYLDYLSPMVYPSHFPNGSIDVDGHPNDFPYETIEVSMRKGREKLGGTAAQIRPWLQDFSFFDLMPYGDDEVRAQIDAAEDVGTSGWMLWDPNNEYHPGALDPEDTQANGAADRAAVAPANGRSVSRRRRLRLHPQP